MWKNISDCSIKITYSRKIMVLTRGQKRKAEEDARVTKDFQNTLRKVPIYKLNDDCLMNVFKHLSIRDRIVSEGGIY